MKRRTRARYARRECPLLSAHGSHRRALLTADCLLVRNINIPLAGRGPSSLPGSPVFSLIQARFQAQPIRHGIPNCFSHRRAEVFLETGARCRPFACLLRPLSLPLLLTTITPFRVKWTIDWCSL